MLRQTAKFKRINKMIAGTGYYFIPTPKHVRVENEDGDFLRYSRSLKAALKTCVPLGAGGRRLDQLLRHC